MASDNSKSKNHETEKLLMKLVRAIVNGVSTDEKDIYSINSVSAPIPIDLLQDDSPGGLMLSGDEARMFYNNLRALRIDRSFEHLNDRSLRDSLWRFVCETYVSKDDLRSRGSVNEFVSIFLTEVSKPLRKYEVLLSLKDVGIEKLEFDLWGYRLFTLKKDRLQDIVGLWKGAWRNRVMEDFADRPVISVVEMGNSLKLVAERARENGRLAVRLLRFYLSHSLKIHEQQLMFDLTGHAIILDESSDLAGTNYEALRIPWGWRITEGDWIFLEKAQVHYKVVNLLAKRMRGSIEIALHWYGLSVEEGNIDQKIVMICSALEALLTTRQDKRKGEAIAYRIALLAMESKKNFVDLDRVLWIYDLRSRIVHGSSLQVATSSEYSTLQYAFKESFDNYVSYTAKKILSKPSKLIKSLEASESVKRLVEGLKQRGTENSLSIRNALVEAIGL